MQTGPAPNPGAALAHLVQAILALDPTLSYAAVARGMGITPQALTKWENGGVPKHEHRLAIRLFISGLVEALPAAYAAAEAAQVQAKVAPFVPTQQAS